MSNSRSRQSKAFNKSVSKAPKAVPLSIDFVHFSSITKRHCCVVEFFWKPRRHYGNTFLKKLGHLCKDTLFKYF